MARRHLIGLLLATEEDWPTALETILGRLGSVRYRGETHELDTERLKNEPFDLRSDPRYALVIDRLSWWYDLPREWLKKIALMDDVDLLNNPFTFQAMEKHAAYCAMMRLGLEVPATWKPFDGGMWVGVSRIAGPEELRFAYDHSGERLMHLQASVEDYDVFTRSLSIGPQT